MKCRSLQHPQCGAHDAKQTKFIQRLLKAAHATYFSSSSSSIGGPCVMCRRRYRGIIDGCVLQDRKVVLVQ
jgi:hypothetical protein